ncbi:MAG TPA: hypothetical protein VGP79_01470 [Bryobacteraceae bacterium]|nr:hypothetical protein [Bryobacteraceae bacterium]
MLKNLRLIQKVAIGFAGLFLGVYLMDFVPGVMDENGKMFGLFGMTPIVDFGHLALGALALISGLISAKISRIYFWALAVWYGIDVITFTSSNLHALTPVKLVLINMPHFLITCAAIYVALKVDKQPAAAATA